MWEKNIHKIRETVGEYPQEGYDAVVCAIKLEWIFIQSITKNTGDAFVGLQKIIWGAFLPYLFFGKSKTLSPILGTLSTMPVSKAGLGLLSSMVSTNEKYLSLQCASTNMVQVVTGEGTFSNPNRLLMFREERRNGQKN